MLLPSLLFTAYAEVEVELKAVLHRITDLRLVVEELEREEDRLARVEAEIAMARYGAQHCGLQPPPHYPSCRAQMLSICCPPPHTVSF